MVKIRLDSMIFATLIFSTTPKSRNSRNKEHAERTCFTVVPSLPSLYWQLIRCRLRQVYEEAVICARVAYDFRAKILASS